MGDGGRELGIPLYTEMEFLDINLTKDYSQSLLLADFKENYTLLWL